MLFRSQLESRLNEARTDFTSASAEHDAATAGRSRLPDGNETAQRVATLQQSSEKARLALRQLQAEQTLTDRSMGAARDRLSSSQSEGRSWRDRSTGLSGKSVSVRVTLGGRRYTQKKK